ncbi:MAG: phosphonate transporter substrate-binding protein [Pseudomonadota bacterium]|jgi:phosphonate transport system substrate-binding protein
MRLSHFLAVLGFSLLALRPAQAEERIYTFAVVPQFPQGQIAATWMPVLAEIEKRAGVKLRLVGSPQIPDFERDFLSGRYDFAYMNPLHALAAARKGIMDPMVRDPEADLRGVLVVLKDGPITDPRQLDGREIAYPAPNALVARLVIEGDLKTKFGVRGVPRYVKTHASVYYNVALGLSPAGGGAATTLALQPPAIRDRLRVIYESAVYPAHPVSVNRRVPAAHRRAVQQAFLAMALDERGRRLLAQVPIRSLKATGAEEYGSLEREDLLKQVFRSLGGDTGKR